MTQVLVILTGGQGHSLADHGEISAIFGMLFDTQTSYLVINVQHQKDADPKVYNVYIYCVI